MTHFIPVPHVRRVPLAESTPLELAVLLLYAVTNDDTPAGLVLARLVRERLTKPPKGASGRKAVSNGR
jgi:hypothetical protein